MRRYTELINRLRFQNRSCEDQAIRYRLERRMSTYQAATVGMRFGTGQRERFKALQISKFGNTGYEI